MLQCRNYFASMTFRTFISEAGELHVKAYTMCVNQTSSTRSLLRSSSCRRPRSAPSSWKVSASTRRTSVKCRCRCRCDRNVSRWPAPPTTDRRPPPPPSPPPPASQLLLRRPPVPPISKLLATKRRKVQILARRELRLSFSVICGKSYDKLEIRSVERGICPIATSTINERTVPIIMAGCMAHEQEGYISTFGLKSDVTIVFLDPDFVYNAGISAIRP